MKNVFVVVVEHPDEDAELYVFASYAKALDRAAKEIAERIVDDDRDFSDVAAMFESGQPELGIRSWNELCDGGHEIHVEGHPILDLEEPPNLRTIFECRTCDRSIGGGTDGTFDTDHLGPWARIDGIDGPNAICPACQKRSDALAGLVEDGYPNARIVR